MPNAPILYPYTKFVACCDASEINFRGTISGIVSGGKYRYIGTSPFPGSGGSLSPDRCYTVTVINSQTFISFPSPPSPPLLTIAASCDDPKCIEDCNPIDCECPDGYTLIDGNCVIDTTIQATYSGTLVTLNAADNVRSYNNQGLRLYPDITANVKPLLGAGATYVVKDNNGAGVTITPLISSLQSTVWGCTTPTACSTFTGSYPYPNYGGRLNIAGLWNTAYNGPANSATDGPELAFEYCIEITETKQYLVGIAGDNKVKLYIDGVLNVFLNTGGSAGTAPFNWWHVFPITLTAGTHVIKLGGINIGTSSAAFAGEIYDITLSQFQANLTSPAIGTSNCGNTISDLAPYIIFSTEDMIGLQVPDPDLPGVWSCPDGSILDECNGVPMCTITDSFPLECPCYLLVPCNGEAPNFISSTLGLAAYVNQFVNITNGGYTGCVYVIQLDPEESCQGSVDVLINSPDLTCDCQPICYYIEGAEGISYVQYIDDSDNLLQISTTASAPWLSICSKIYPIVSNTTSSYTITALGSCIDDECAQKCYKLTDCNDVTNVLYSNTYNLLPYAISGGSIKIAGYAECWTVDISEDPCDCVTEVIIVNNFTDCKTCEASVTTAYKLTACDVNFGIQYTYDDLSAYVGKTLLTDCGCFTVELINYPPPSTQSITIITSFDDCVDCQRPYYKLIDCSTAEEVYTFTDVSSYVGQVIKIENCDSCWTVEETIIPINPTLVTVVSSHVDCVTCITTAPCICSTVRNDNTIDFTYDYVDCYGETQSVIVAPGATSSKRCLIKWLEPKDCECIIETKTVGATIVNTVLEATGTLMNYKETWENVDGLYIYYNGTQWIMNDSSLTPAYYLDPSDADCPNGVWKSFSSVPTVDKITIVTNACQNHYNYFGNCDNGVCPSPIYLKRTVRPGYNTPTCSIEKYDLISCKAADALYRNVLTLRYGISNCCPEEEEEWLVKYELIELASLYNPDYPCTPVGGNCGCAPSSCSCS
jgi:hypothetical protein